MAGGGKIKIIKGIDLINPKFEFGFGFEDPRSYNFNFGGVLQNKVMMCRGAIDQDAIILGQSNNQNHIQLLKSRYNASSGVILFEKYLWITGGAGMKNATEFISLDKPPFKGPDLPFRVWGHSMIKVDANTIYLIGGYQVGKFFFIFFLFVNGVIDDIFFR